MKNSKRSGSRDRLSELPDSLILAILSLLPMRDVVMTTLLSKRWKDIWTTVPCLNFNTDFKDLDDANNAKDDKDEACFEDKFQNIRFQNFVNRALVHWKGTKILKFEVALFYYEEPPSSDLDVWLRFAIDNKVEELYVNLLNDWELGDGQISFEYCPLQRLYSCLSIKKLSLVGCNMDIRGNVQWDQLKCLTIDRVYSLSQSMLDQVLSASPQLEVLFLRHDVSYKDLNILSDSLKVLTIENRQCYWYAEEDTALTIWAPNVETLKKFGRPYGNNVMMNVSFLINAVVDVYSSANHIGQILSCKLLEDILGQVYQTNRHVERVTLTS